MVGSRTCIAAVLVAATLSISVADATHATQEDGLAHFFDSVDANRDGEIEAAEAAQFIGQSFEGDEYDSGWQVRDAVEHMKTMLDGTDKGVTVSENEIQQHLKSMQQVGQRAHDEDLGL